MKTTASFGATVGRRLTVALLAAVMVGLFGVLLAQGPAQAHDHRIPNTVLKKGAKELQTGHRVIESQWVFPAGDGLCEVRSTYYTFELLDGSGFNYPEADRVAAGSELRVRISKTQRPDSFSVAAYPEIDEHGNPSGGGRLLRRSLERVVVEGKTVAWDAEFAVKEAGRDYYLIAEGHWQDREGCDTDQYAHWSFHIETRA